MINIFLKKYITRNMESSLLYVIWHILSKCFETLIFKKFLVAEKTLNNQGLTRIILFQYKNLWNTIVDNRGITNYCELVYAKCHYAKTINSKKKLYNHFITLSFISIFILILKVLNLNEYSSKRVIIFALLP